jgi:aspartyl-tRNA(Asn)/glutamyl-tRNA(Gln) amidotransferase subunit A
VVGLKPTYGRVSRYGLVAFASSLDQIGPMARDVRDCALLLQVLAGHDPLDSTSVPADVPDYAAALEESVKGLRVGVPAEFFEYRGSRVSDEIEDAVRAAVRVFEGLGAACDEVSTPHLQYVIPVYYIIAPAEASSNLARYDGVAYGHRTTRGAADVIELYEETREEGFGAEVKRRIMLGTYALSAGYYDAYYLKASQVRTLIRRDFEKAFENHDLLVAPVTPSLPFRLGEKTDDPVRMYLSDVCTIAANMAGLPAISIPGGYANGLPIGLQIIGKPLDEATVLRAAHAFQQATDFHRLAPLGALPGDARRAVVTWAGDGGS